MRTIIENLLEYKLKAIERNINDIAKNAIQYEINQLNKVLSLIDINENELFEARKNATVFEEAKAIAEMILLLHGIPGYVIESYYNGGIEYTLRTLEQLYEDDSIIVPKRLKPLLNDKNR